MVTAILPLFRRRAPLPGRAAVATALLAYTLDGRRFTHTLGGFQISTRGTTCQPGAAYTAGQ